MLTDPYVVNITSVNDFAACRFRWLCKWVLNRVPIHDSVPLTVGQMGHIIFEDVHKGLGDFKGVIQSRRAEWHEQMILEADTFNHAVMQKAIQTLDDLTEALIQWKDGYEFEIPCLETECPFEFDLMPGVVLRGRPDRVGVMEGALWHVQHKFLAGQTHFGVYLDLAKRNYHEHAYMEALHQKYPQYEVGGTLFDLIRKLKYRTYVGKKNETTKTYEEMFMQFPMSIDLNSPLHQHVMESIKSHVMEMRMVEELYRMNGSIPAPNEGANGGYFHNQPDDFFRVLVGEIQLDDDRYFKPRVETYAVTEEE
jgi:hypothetical protein